VTAGRRRGTSTALGRPSRLSTAREQSPLADEEFDARPGCRLSDEVRRTELRRAVLRSTLLRSTLRRARRHPVLSPLLRGASPGAERPYYFNADLPRSPDDLDVSGARPYRVDDVDPRTWLEG
jgi:hypothetical protein